MVSMTDEPKPLTEEELDAKLATADDVERERRHYARLYPKEATTTPWVGFHPDEVRRLVAEVRRLRVFEAAAKESLATLEFQRNKAWEELRRLSQGKP
jgi:hypothetical protein